MNNRLALVPVFVFFPALVHAEVSTSYQCTQGDLVRRVEVAYEAGGAMPCEVRYHKDSEAPGEEQVLWSASSEQGYCEARATEFVAKLEGWGWDCGSAAPDADAAGTEPDDTDALEPAGEPDAE